MTNDHVVYERLERKFAQQKKNIVIVGSLIGKIIVECDNVLF